MAELDIRSNLSEEEKRRLEKIDRIDSNKKRKKIILVFVTIILITFFVAGTIFGGMHILSYEGTQALPEEEVNLPEIPDGENEILTSLFSLIDDTKNYNGVKLDISFDVSVPDSDINITGENAESVKVYVDYIKGSLVSIISDCYSSEHHEGEYSENFSEFLFSTEFTENDAEVTAFCDEEDENKLFYEILFAGCDYDDIENNIVYDIFSLDISSDVIKTLKEKFSGMVSVGDAQLVYESFTVKSETDRIKEQLKSVSLSRVCNVTLPLSFIGEWADFGDITVTFKIELTKKYNFTHVEFYFTQDVFYIESGSSDEIKTKVISDQSPADVVLTFESSDPDILTFDGRFYKAKKVSDKPIVVTGRYVYNGIEYVDECIFYVRVPVEGVKVTEKEVTLKAGETKKIDAKFSPDNATLTTVYWFTTDENIVTVNENGEITAVSAGNASVYCITLDGNYKSSCNVTVTE